MNLSLFTENKTGQIIEVSGIPGVTHAFIPDPLPPKWEWNNELWPLLVRAKEELARLDGTGSHLPNPHLLITPLQRREAQLSSRLEGTFATPDELLLFEINPAEVETARTTDQAAREVMNYTLALQYRENKKNSLPVSLRLISELHRILLSKVRGSSAEPGDFRRGQVKIGSDARYVPPPANYLIDCLDKFEKYLYADKKYDSLAEAFIAHYQFEAIHPFLDGNGRVGRLLLSIIIEDWCNLAGEWLYMSPYFEKTKSEYIERLFRISTDGDWDGWLKYCFNGVINQSLDAQKRCSRLLSLRDEYHRRLDNIKSSGRLYQIVDSLFVRPFTTVPGLRDKYEINYLTAKADIKHLIDLSIVDELILKMRRQKAYICRDIFEITYEDV